MNKAEQILIGSMAGDGSIQKTGNGYRYEEYHSIKQEKYLLWKKIILEKILGEMSFCKKDNVYVRIYSKQNNILEDIRKELYKKDKGNKILTKNFLNKLDALGLAVWYMDDGTFNKESKSMRFSTNYDNKDAVKEFFNKKLNIDIGITKQKGCNCCIIRISRLDSIKLKEIIRPYIHKELIYKIEQTKEDTDITRIKRNTRMNKYMKLYNKKLKETKNAI